MWKSDEILSENSQKIEKYDYISFDIFDTIILRKVDKPYDIFLKVGEESIRNGIIRKNITAVEFQQIRIISEREARKIKKKINDGKDNEISIYDIYNEMPNNIGDKKTIMHMECEIEKRYTYLNIWIYSYIKKLKSEGKKIYLITNMYLSRKKIETILEKCGFDLKIIEDIFVSSDIGYNKSTGNLFNYVLSKLNINSDKIIHIGDDYEADIQGSKKAHINSVYYNVINKESQQIDFESYKFGKCAPELTSIRKLALNATALYPIKEKFWYKLGIGILGPIFTLFSDYVANLAKNNHIKIIKPFMREAVLLGPLIEKAILNKQYDCKVEPLYISRMSTLLPSLEEINKENLDKIFEIRNINLDNVLELLGIEKDEFIDFDIDLKKPLYHIAKNKLQKISDKILTYSATINDNICKKRKIITEYFDQENILHNNIMTVDIGYSATTQYNLEKILKIQNIKSNIIHTIMLASDKIPKKLQKGINIQSYSGIYQENIELLEPIMHSKRIIEEAIGAEIGSTLGYKVSNNMIEPILDNNRIPKEEFKYKKACRDGILKFQELYYMFLGDYEIRYNNIEMLKILFRLIKIPTYEESVKLSNLHHEDNFGSKNVAKFFKKADFDMLKEMKYDKFLETAKYRNVIWPESIIEISQSNYFQNKVIESSYYTPKYYKEILKLISKIKDKGIDKVIIWGAGEVGRIMVNFFKKEKINIVMFIDRKEWLWNTEVDRITIKSPMEARSELKENSANVIIASFSFIEDIKEDVVKYIDNAKIYTLC